MPRIPKAEQFDPNSVCIFDLVQRCIRRAYLAVVDAVTGKNFEHRREWIRCRMERLASVFGIDAILSNHMHVVIVRQVPWFDRSLAWRSQSCGCVLSVGRCLHLPDRFGYHLISQVRVRGAPTMPPNRLESNSLR